MSQSKGQGTVWRWKDEDPEAIVILVLIIAAIVAVPWEGCSVVGRTHHFDATMSALVEEHTPEVAEVPVQAAPPVLEVVPLERPAPAPAPARPKVDPHAGHNHGPGEGHEGHNHGAGKGHEGHNHGPGDGHGH